jgi:uroporphyrinogen-III decarboxylase
MCTGTPEQVRQYCKKLIDIVGKNGGLIVDGDVGIPDEAKVENVRAMTDFVKEFGVYR